VKNCRDRKSPQGNDTNELSKRKRRNSFFLPKHVGHNSIFAAYGSSNSHSRQDFENLFNQDFQALLKSATKHNNGQELKSRRQELKAHDKSPKTRSGMFTERN
jgi:hypothetical protein